MDRREFIAATVAIGAGLGGAAVADAAASKADELDRSGTRDPMTLIKSTLVVDGYSGMIGTGPLKGQAATDEYVRRLKAAGIGCKVGRLEHPAMAMARSVKEIRALHAKGKIAQVYCTDAIRMGTEHLEIFSTAPFPVAKYHADGLRIMGLAYNLANAYGGGCLDPQVPLTRAGRRLVEEAHKHRVLLDVGGHNGERTSLDVIAMAPEIPVINTHGNVRALNDNPRCNSDRMIEAIAKTGGVVGITTFSDFMARNPSNSHLMNTPQVGLDKYLDQFDHVKKLVGADHVGVSPDNICDGGAKPCPWETQNRLVMAPEAYSEIWTWVKGFERMDELPNFVKGLIERGWTTKDIRKVLGENWLRVYEKAWGA